jgi:hypothetical protein
MEIVKLFNGPGSVQACDDQAQRLNKREKHVVSRAMFSSLDRSREPVEDQLVFRTRVEEVELTYATGPDSSTILSPSEHG